MPPDYLNKLVEKIFEQLGGGKGGIPGEPPQMANLFIERFLSQLVREDNENDSGDFGKDKKVTLTPAKILVLLGILGGVFEVHYLLVNKEQTVQVLLEGTLKRKTEMDKILDSLGHKTFDEIMQAMADRFG